MVGAVAKTSASTCQKETSVPDIIVPVLISVTLGFVVFCATIGLNAQIADLFKGGRLLVLLLGLALAFMVLQNVVGLLGVTLFGLPSATSVLVGSASLIGGHGTAIAWLRAPAARNPNFQDGLKPIVCCIDETKSDRQTAGQSRRSPGALCAWSGRRGWPRSAFGRERPPILERKGAGRPLQSQLQKARKIRPPRPDCAARSAERRRVRCIRSRSRYRSGT